MARRKPSHKTPKGTSWKEKAAPELTRIDLGTQAGRAQLWHERLTRARRVLCIEDRGTLVGQFSRFLDGSFPREDAEHVYLSEALPALLDVVRGTLPRKPPVQVEARQAGQEDLARDVGALVDATLESDTSRAFKTARDILWDELAWGIAIGKVGWLERVTNEPYRPTTDAEYLRPQVQQAMGENADPISLSIADGDDHAVHIQIHDKILSTLMPDMPEHKQMTRHISAHWARLGTRKFSHPVLYRIAPNRFLYDPDATTWEDRRWEAELCDEFVYDLQGIPGVKNLNPENCPPIDEFDSLYGTTEVGQRDVADQTFDFEGTRVQVWKIHDRNNGQYTIIPALEGKETRPLLETDWPYGSTEIYKSIVNYRVPGQIHGHSAFILIQPICYELAKTNAAIRKHVKRAARAKMIGPRGAMDRKGIQDIESDRGYAEVPMEAAGSLKEFKPPSLPPELMEFREILLGEMRRVLGSDIMHQGGDTPHKISATEAGLRGTYQTARLEDRQDNASDFMTWVAKTCVMLYREFADEDLIVRTLGAQGMQISRISPESLPEDLSIRLDVYSATDAYRQERLAATKEFITAVTTMLPPGTYDAVGMLIDWANRADIPNAQKYFLMGAIPGQGGLALPSSPGQGSQTESAGGSGESWMQPNLKIANGSEPQPMLPNVKSA